MKRRALRTLSHERRLAAEAESRATVQVSLGTGKGVHDVLKFLESAVGSIDQRLILLAPPDRAIPEIFTGCEFDANRHATHLRDLQRLRGSIYLRDGAIDPCDLSADGLHETTEDDRAWHLLLLNARGKPAACAWYREHLAGVPFSRLRLRLCPLATDPQWRDALWRAVTRDISRAKEDGLHYAEVGGWAVAEESRGTAMPLVLALATYALARICGGALTITTATTRHGSCDILARIGGRELDSSGTTLPRYYDPRYRCAMQILRFDSRAPNRRFEGVVAQLEQVLVDVPVIARPYWPMVREPRRAAVATPVYAPAASGLESRVAI